MSVVPATRTDLASGAFRDSVREAAGDGSNTIGIVLQYFQKSLTSSHIYAAPTLPTSAVLRKAVAFVRGQGLKVAFKVFFDVQPAKGKYTSPWRFHINPANRAAWFADATKIEVALAKHKPDLFIIGTEMGSVTEQRVDKSNGARWTKLIRAVRRVDPGQLTYEAQTPSASRPDEASNISFWSSLNFMSFSAYHVLGATCADSSVAAMTAQWKAIDRSIYVKLSARFHKSIAFGEIGYSSYTCDHRTPYKYFGSSPKSGIDMAEQTRDLTAFFRYWSSRPGFLGALLWNWQPSAKAGGPTNSDFTVQNKPAEAVARVAFRGRSDLVDVYWPTSTFAYTHTEPDSVQPFQAVFPDTPLDDYRMYWSVSGGHRTLMPNGTADDGTPEKRIDVDVNTWTWNADAGNTYPVTFTATTLGGQVIAESTVTITISS